MLRSGVLAGGDGLRVDGDRLSSGGSIVDYRLTKAGHRRLSEFGIDFDHLPPRRPLVRYCVDWSEQHHHLSGALGAALTARMFELGWISRAPRARAVLISAAGREGFQREFGVLLTGRKQTPADSGQPSSNGAVAADRAA